MSKGGSLRISTASSSKSGRSTVSCGRYQSSSLSVSESRVARATTDFLDQRSAVCSQTRTLWPRACAARIIATVVSLYALSSSGGSMMKRRTRLLALRDHEVDSGADLRVGERGTARLGRHRALALDYRFHQRRGALLDARRPRFLVAELRRAGEALRVAGEADLVVNRLAVARCCGGFRLSRGRFGLGFWRDRNLRLHLRSLRLGSLLRRRGLLELGAGLVRHVDHCARHLVVGKRGIAALRRHRAFALDGDRHHRLEAVLDTRRPRAGVADLRRVGHAGLVAGGARGLDDGLAAACARRRRGLAEFQPTDRLDAGGDG